MSESQSFPTSPWPVTPEQFDDWREQLKHYLSLDLPTQTDVVNWLEYTMLQRDRSQHERNEAQNRIHDMKSEIANLDGRYKKLCTWLKVDPDDHEAVEIVIADLKGFQRFKSREAGGKLRSGEGWSPETLKHYEEKLADKRSRIRQLEKVVIRLRDQVKALGGNPDEKKEDQTVEVQADARSSETARPRAGQAVRQTFVSERVSSCHGETKATGV